MSPLAHEPSLLQEMFLYAAIFFFPVGAIVLGRRVRELTGFARVLAVTVIVLGVVCAPLAALVVLGIALFAVGAVVDVINYGNVTPADRRAFIDFALVLAAVIAILQFTRRKRFVIFTAPK